MQRECPSRPAHFGTFCPAMPQDALTQSKRVSGSSATAKVGHKCHTMPQLCHRTPHGCSGDHAPGNVQQCGAVLSSPDHASQRPRPRAAQLAASPGPALGQATAWLEASRVRQSNSSRCRAGLQRNCHRWGGGALTNRGWALGGARAARCTCGGDRHAARRCHQTSRRTRSM